MRPGRKDMKTEKIDFLIGYLQEMKKEMEQSSPPSDFRALTPGRKVLEIETKDILRVGNKDRDGLFLQRSNYHELDTFTWEKLSKGYQIIHEGPFDAGKLKAGDWVWNTPLDKWVTFEGYADQCNIVSIFKDPETGNRYCYNYLSRDTHSFSPPTPPSREERIEKATEKIWHLIDRAANQSTVAKEEAHAILTELMEAL